MLGTKGHLGVTVATITGQTVAELAPGVLPAVMFSRESCEVSRCEFQILNENEDVVTELVPWYHWVTVWEDTEPVWRGPIQNVRIGRHLTAVSARDVSTFAWRTRTPMSKTWRDTNPSAIALELYTAMLALHRVNVAPMVRPDLTADTFTISTQIDSRMMNQVMDDLTKIGLKWTVVAGKPVFGPMLRTPVSVIDERDILDDIEIVRDGTNTFNDVRVQGKNFTSTHKEELGGLNLQTLVSMDDMFGVSNIQRATQQYAKQVSMIRDQLVVPTGASLDLDSAITLDQLVPGNRFVVHARDIASLMELTQVEINSTPGTFTVNVSLETVYERTELETRTGVMM